MTCTYGASVRAGLDPTTKVLVDRSLWETVTGTPSSWWDWLLGVFPLTYITASELCSLNLADPVLPPLATIAAAFFRDPSSIVTVYDYVRDKLQYSAFANACVCNAGPVTCTTPQFVGPFNGFGAGSSNESLGNYFVIDAPCDITGVTLWAISGAGYPQAAHVDLWDNATAASVRDDVVTIGAGSNASLNWTAGAYTPVVGHTYCVSIRKVTASAYPGQTGVSGVTWNPYAHETGPSYYNPSGFGFPSNSLGALVGIEPILCSTSAPTTPTAPTVPPQPTTLPVPPDWVCTSVGDVCLRLQQLSEKVDWLIRSAPAVTSSSVAEGTSHPGLTGSGTLVVSGILGLRVVLTTIPLSYGSYPGTPTVHFGVGRINWSTSEGWLQESLLDVTPKEILGFPPTVTSIGYSLPSGVVATVTELVKGP